MKFNILIKTLQLLLVSAIGILNANSSPLTNNDLKEITADIELINQFKEEQTIEKNTKYLYKKFINYDILLTQYKTLHSFNMETDEFNNRVHHKIKSALHMMNNDYPVPELSSFSYRESNRGGSGIIRGKVIDENTQLPLENVHMAFYSDAGTYVSSTTTDLSGRYIMQNLAPGRYLVKASETNYAEEFYNGILCPRGLGFGCQVNDIDALDLQPSQIISDVDFSLVNGPVITGRIVDQDTGLPLRARVNLLTDNEMFDAYVNSSSSDGSFELVASGSGEYYIQFENNLYIDEMYDNVWCGQQCDYDLVPTVTLSSNTTTDLGDIGLKKPASISGTLFDQDDNMPILNGYPSIRLYNSTDEFIDNLSSWQINEGLWEFEGIQPGEYYTIASSNGYFAEMYFNQDCPSRDISSCFTFTPDLIVHDGVAAVNNVDMTLIKIPPAPTFINGVVRLPNGDPIDSDSYVRLHRILDNGTPSSSYHQSNVDQNGNYAFSDVAAGSYLFVASTSDYHNDAYPGVPGCDISIYNCSPELFGTPLVISESTQTINFDFNLHQYPSLSGLVKDNNNATIGSATVTLEDIDTGYRYTERTDSNGEYLFEQVQQGNYKLYASFDGHASVAYQQVVCSNYNCSNQSGAQTIDIEVGNDLIGYEFSLSQLPTLNVEFISAVNSIRGELKIYDSNGNNVYNQYVNGLNKEFNIYPGSYYLVYKENQYSDNKNVNKIYGGPNCYETCDPLLGQLVTVGLNQSYDFIFNLDQHFKVQFQDKNFRNYFDIKFYDSNNQLVLNRSSSSSSSGEIYFDSLESIKIGVTKLGYYSYYHENIQCHGEACGLDTATVINPQVNQSISIDFSLQSLADISGIMMDESQQPLDGIVELFNASGNKVKSYATSNDGVFSLIGISPGNYYLKGISSGHQSMLFDGVTCLENCDATIGSPIEVFIGVDISDIEIRLPRYGSIEINAARYVNGDVVNSVRVEMVDVNNLNQNHPGKTIYDGNTQPLLLPPGMYQIITDDNDVIRTAYPDIDCSQISQQECINQSTIISIDNYDEVTLTDFIIHKKGEIRGEALDEITNEPVIYHRINLYDDDFQLVDYANTNSNGEFVFSDLSSGSYYLELIKGNSHMGELFNDVNCYEGIGVSCMFTEGFAVDVAADTIVSVNFSPTQKPELNIHAINSYNLSGINTDVRVYSHLLGSAVISSNNKTIHNLLLSPGEYWIIAEARDYNIKGYPDVICESFNINQCESGLLSINLEMGDSKSIQLELELLQGINGFVTDAVSGEPVADVIIDAWRNNYHDDLTVTSPNGGYSIRLNRDQDYYLSTDLPTSLPYYNEVYKNKHCFDGPAILDFCSPYSGSPLRFDYYNDQPIEANFELDIDEIFLSDFE
ncbi:carboxypeptidase-like regulatory domain-containing protein [Marinicella litoralis]|uniref:Carboxypeptidase family protein n=1 Tax=Marinicella litoralis TaxID=644220 RepID=A0A4V3DI16_9GAMM|nr:carboxypeptidase-like regulatory domain-containing protein [Marinicella litoralis]TDR20391.1 carboxypeptidase family protein [Marinicella litoralis]